MSAEAAGPLIVQAGVDLVDPHDCTDDPDKLALLEAVHEALVRRGPDGRWWPALAESWSVSDDARSWTFDLRPGIRCHDGAPADAEAVAWSVTRMARPDMGATLGAPAVWAQYLAGAKATVVSGSTVRIDLERPTADLLDILGSGYVLSPQAGEGEPVGCGAYRVEARAPDGRMTLRAGEGRGMPNPVLHLQGVAAPGARSAAVADGSAQVASGLDREAAARLARQAGVTLVGHLSPTAIIFLFNAARGPLQDPRVRRALNLALDRQALVSGVLGGAGRALDGFLSPMHFGAPAVADTDGTDRDTARRLLDEAGWSDGLTLDVTCPTSLPDEAEALTAAVAAQLEPLGVSFRVELVEDRVAYANRVRRKEIGDLCVFDSSPMSSFRVLYEKIDSRVGGSWWQGYCNREVEALLDRARATVEDAGRKAIYRQCYRLLQVDPPWLYLYNHSRHVALAGRQPGWRMRGDGVLDLRALPAL
ncbi:MAG: ABC transporter substrate-binding protein [Thalassobaculum sp.]|uniref:ABC transporter substrate-binding protein n=1 Tax=Thalassobaculum sp. TaxID=2022740 RepID=UPI0032EEEEC4